jgi:GLPGLI family protein
MMTIKSTLSKLALTTAAVLFLSTNTHAQDFQGKAYYLSKSTMDLGQWGARMSEVQKKQIMERLKNRLEKTYILSFNKEESFFKEDEKLDAISGATDSWGKNFAQGEQYKNVKTKTLVQNQEFYGKKFLVKDKLQELKWNMSSETKTIGKYSCFKATALVPTSELTWYNFSWSNQRNNEDREESGMSEEASEEEQIEMTEIEAWYTMSIPVSHGPSEYWGLPGLILEVSAGDTTMLCFKILMNPDEKSDIEAPKKGTIITKKEYQETIAKKMGEMRNMYRRR